MDKSTLEYKMEREQISYHIFYGTMPLLVYLGISAVLVYVASALHWDSSLLNFVNAAANLLVLYFIFYRPYQRRCFGSMVPVSGGRSCGRQERAGAMPVWTYLFIPVIGICCSLAVNQWFQIFRLSETIDSYEKVAQHIYSGSLLAIVIRTGVLAPAMEELLMRGLIYNGISRVVGKVGGVVLSSLIFGVIHGNLLQGIYAGLLGVIFAVLYEIYDRNLFSCILAHMSANLVSVAGTMVPQTSRMIETYFYLLTFVSTLLLFLCMAGVLWCHRRYRTIPSELSCKI